MTRFALSASLLLTLTLALGCTEAEKPAPAPSTPAASNTPPKDDHGHKHAGHGAGPHDGVVADWGGGKYHVEFTVDHDKKEATVYVLGSDEKTAAPIKAADGKILLTIKEPEFQVELAASPLDGEAEGTSSRFVGQHDNLGIVREFEGSITGEVDGTPFTGNFKEEPHGEHEHADKKGDDKK